MHRTRSIGGFIIIAVGAIWIGQGTGLLRGSSFMVGDLRWAAIGLIAVGAGIGILVVDLRLPR
jgi:hypothetical protein